MSTIMDIGYYGGALQNQDQSTSEKKYQRLDHVYQGDDRYCKDYFAERPERPRNCVISQTSLLLAFPNRIISLQGDPMYVLSVSRFDNSKYTQNEQAHHYFSLSFCYISSDTHINLLTMSIAKVMYPFIFCRNCFLRFSIH